MTNRHRKRRPVFGFFKRSKSNSTATSKHSKPEVGDRFEIEESDENVIEINDSTTDIFIPESSLKEYVVLGVDEEISDIELKKRYRTLAKENHPDNGGDPKEFMRIQKAYKKIMKHRGNERNTSICIK